ncbi:MAG: hypothetical protein ABIQ70_03535 [Dokdonella sp.]
MIATVAMAIGAMMAISGIVVIAEYAAANPASGLSWLCALVLFAASWALLIASFWRAWRVRRRMLAWSTTGSALPADLTGLAYQPAQAVLGLLSAWVLAMHGVFCFEHAFTTGYDNEGCRWVVEISIFLNTLGGIFAFTFGFAALARVRARKAELLVGKVGDLIRQEWVGHARLPIYGTPYMAEADDMPLVDLPQTPGLGPLRRIRQFCGTEISLMRDMQFLAVWIPVQSVLMIYASPVPAQAFYLAFNLGMAVVSVFLIQVSVLRLERDEQLSQAFCRSDQKIHFGAMMLTYMIAPVLVVALAVMLALQPGMRDWYDALLQPIIGKILG